MKDFLRLATEMDVDLLFEWVNEPTVRKNSFSTQDILYDEHCKWFQKILSDQTCRQYIYVHNGQDVGQIRIQINGEEAEISYSICVQKRGEGYGKQMLQLMSEKIKQDFPNVRKLIGKVKPDNVASQKAFQEKGFEEKYHVYELLLSDSL